MATYERKELLGDAQLAQAMGDIPHWDFREDRFAEGVGIAAQRGKLVADRLVRPAPRGHELIADALLDQVTQTGNRTP